MTRQSAIDSFTEIATLRIELNDSDPLIWRELEVPTSITLKVLHEIVQTAMGWLDYHLWEMVIDHQTYGLPRFRITDSDTARFANADVWGRLA